MPIYPQKTLSKRNKSIKKTCPKCQKVFARLDTHLKNSATCKLPHAPETSATSSTIPEPSQPDSQCPIQPPVTSPLPGTRRPRPTITKAPFNCPRTAEEWEEADKELSRTVVPTVQLADTVEERNQALCEGVYEYFSSKYGTRSQKKPKSKKHRGKGNAASNKARMMRNQARNDLRKEKRSGQDPQAIKKVAQKFHKFLRQHNQMQKATIRKSKHNEARRARKDCAKHFWSFASQTLDGDSSSKQVEPAFQADAAESFFTHVYSSCKREYKQPEWLPDAPAPQQEFDESPITEEQLLAAIKKSRSQSSPSPLDQVTYLVSKRCPCLVPVLVDLFNCCWQEGTIPIGWKQGVIRLIPKAAATESPQEPSNFRPIAMTSCVGKLFTTVLKNRWLSFMVSNGYLDTSVQKAFLPNIPGCLEQYEKLSAVIQEAHK